MHQQILALGRICGRRYCDAQFVGGGCAALAVWRIHYGWGSGCLRLAVYADVPSMAPIQAAAAHTKAVLALSRLQGEVSLL